MLICHNDVFLPEKQGRINFKKVCNLFGSQLHVAEILGVSDRTVRRWVKADKCDKWVIEKLLEYNNHTKQSLEAILIIEYIAKGKE